MHAFVDESRRNDTYLLAVAVIQPQDLTRLRKHLRGLLLPGQRELRFHKEKPARRRLLLASVVKFDFRVDVYRSGCRSSEEAARQKCLARATGDLLDLRMGRLVLDSRSGRDRIDQLTIQRVLADRPRRDEVAYEHWDSTSEPLLWTADLAAWCFGAGGDWARRAAPVLGAVIDVK
ncbi:hypothetical protein ABZ816_12780 [Actinosynnema sp. NPDC047251]|uniref:hypothetical protein n=1 Tax=Saccharothrix espanaensis TaxID=103731 RepID=UPI001E38DAFD|nr:hypothetical protein [Saccharothrix espanaensis]